MNDFVEWLQAELDSRGWSRSEAARRGNISASMMDKVINRFAHPGIKFCKGIARAFSLPQDEVLRRADLLNPTWQQLAATDATISEVVEVIRQMGEADREDVLRYSLYRLGLSKSDEIDERAKRARKLKPRSADEQ